MIRKAEQSDLDDLLAVQLKAYYVHTTWLAPEQIPPLKETAEDVQKDLQSKTVLAASADGKIVGSVRYIIKTGVCILERLSVDPGYQKRGIGGKLVAEVDVPPQSEMCKPLSKPLRVRSLMFDFPHVF